MRILCLVKPVPDADSFDYDYERNVLRRDRVRMILNPDDTTALARALRIKDEDPTTYVETVSMAPKGVIAHLEDLVRRGVDRATLISDTRYLGSDTYVTSRVLAKYLQESSFDVVFCGTHTMDGGTGHVGHQIAELLDLPSLSDISDLQWPNNDHGKVVVAVEGEDSVTRYTLVLPGVLGFLYNPKIKLPYLSYEAMNQDFSDRILVLSNEDLEFETGEVGLKGSLTWVESLEVKAYAKKDTQFVEVNEEGIRTVYEFLKNQGLVEV